MGSFFNHFQQFVAQSQIDAEIKFAIQRKLDHSIDDKLPGFERKNQAKHNDYIVSLFLWTI